jgi:hypothetical protein
MGKAAFVGWFVLAVVIAVNVGWLVSRLVYHQEKVDCPVVTLESLQE